MRKGICTLLAVMLLLTGVSVWCPKAHALAKANETRAIAIVFDNSGSMYIGSNAKAWCRATYAMEVFASMLNAGDTLMIYPMHPIVVGGNEYTMENPYRITDSSQAHTIREIYTPGASTTPIESVDCAIQGLTAANADKKTVIVLTDGDAFYLDSAEMSRTETKRQLDARFAQHAGKGMSVMYLGIGENAVMPDTPQSEYFVKEQAKNSADVLSALTAMCNRIFGRDTLPKNHISGNTLDFDISLNKLIVFVQGENVSNLSISGDVGKKLGETSTKYGTAGSDRGCDADVTLQGMMVTYEDCAAGSYTINYSGTANSIEVYYEPAADLDFVFTDAAGNGVAANTLYEGEYKVSFGMKDAKTGKLISSDLLGSPQYRGSYFINGEEHIISHDGQSGEVPLSLDVNDTLNAKLTVTYLSGYTITKDSSDFNWPENGIQVCARPAGELKLEISGGEDVYSLQKLEQGAHYTAKVFYQGAQLAGEELEKTLLKWNPEESHAEVKKEFAGDHYKLTLHYKDPAAPQNTLCGECAVAIYAFYTEEGSSEAQAQAPLVYNIEDDFSPLELEMGIAEDYILISELAAAKAITVKPYLNGTPLTPAEFAATELQVDCGGIDYTLGAKEGESAYVIQLNDTPGISEGKYDIKVAARYTDNIGRAVEAEKQQTITLGSLPLWAVWAIRIGLLLLLIFITLLILHIKVLPKNAYVYKRDSTMYYDDEDVTDTTSFTAKMKGGRLDVQNRYAGTNGGLSMAVKPGKGSYLRKPQKRRSAEVASASVTKRGAMIIHEATIGAVRYELNSENGRLERVPPSDKPFVLKHGTNIRYSGVMENNGETKEFSVATQIKFTKR